MAKVNLRKRNIRKLKAFGLHLRKLRLERNLTQEELADIAKISATTIVILEAGALNTTIAMTFEIAKALGIKERDLFDF